MESTIQLPVYEDVCRAAERLIGKVMRTPLLESDGINQIAGCRVLVKAENLQPIGAFKIRGAFNVMGQLSAPVRSRGVVAFSSGNHGRAIACAAKHYGARAVIVMPDDAPVIKVEAVRALGAEIVRYNRHADCREAMAKAIADENQMTLIPSYDHPGIIAGQGTAALELVEQVSTLDVTLDALLVPCGGGGLTAGCSLVMAERSPETRVYAVEPEQYDDTKRSLASGQPVKLSDLPPSCCDALLIPQPGELTFPINKQVLSGAFAVSETDVWRAVAMAYKHLRIVLEPSGAVGLAAVLSGSMEHTGGGSVAVIASGGNIDAQVFAEKLLSFGDMP